MNIEIIQQLMHPMTLITSIDGGVRVSTHCLYPSNGTVSVSVRKQIDSYVVADDRGAVQEANSVGLQFRDLKLSDIDRKLKSIVRIQGLVVKDGVISSPRVTLNTIPAAVLLVANASKEAASWMLDTLKITLRRDFKKDVSDLLERHFNQNLKHNEPVVGQSNKQHHFSHVIHLSGQRRLLIDPVMNDASSINARVIANLDVKMLHDPKTIQHVIYDDTDAWKSSDLKLLEIGAPALPFSKAETIIKKLAS